MEVGQWAVALSASIIAILGGIIQWCRSWARGLGERLDQLDAKLEDVEDNLMLRVDRNNDRITRLESRMPPPPRWWER